MASIKEEKEAKQMEAQLAKTLKEGERILGPTRRPDGSLRKPIRIRSGYIPQDEVPIYQSKGALWKKEMAAMQEVPPGYEPEMLPKAKSKSAKRNERKKDKRQQASPDKYKNLENGASTNGPNHMESVTSQLNELTMSTNSSTVNLPSAQMNELTMSTNSSMVNPPSNSNESETPEVQIPDIDKKIRALKKKIRLTEAQQQKTAEKDMKPEQLEKVAKLEDWRKELKLLEEKKAKT